MSFTASRGWFNPFRKSSNLHNLGATSEAVSADTAAADAFIVELKKIIAEEGYLPEQMFNADKTYWVILEENAGSNLYS